MHHHGTSPLADGLLGSFGNSVHMVSADAGIRDVLIVKIKIVKKFLTVEGVVVSTIFSYFDTVLCSLLLQGSFAAEGVTHS